MTEPPEMDFKSAFVDLLDAEAVESEHHPEPELLARLHRGELAGEQAEALREHLIGCRPCFARYHSPEAFAAPGPGSDFELAAFWRSLRPRLMEARQEKAPHRARWPLALAAGLALACLGLAFWALLAQSHLAASRRQLAELAGPQANARIYDLKPVGSMRGGSGAPLEVPQGGFTLLLAPQGSPSGATYSLVIQDAAGREVQLIRGLAPDTEDGTLAVWLPRGLLAPGKYRLELYRDGEPAPRERVGEYHLVVRP
ncbi:MAG TPA: zf-HC2 domain-containing protein [Thermoanaerobaculia bacterium]|nr:zf-HC2 domain-containing protein [Thermoanaerobaculia bacterium]